MLMAFRFSNFRSFKDRAEISLKAHRSDKSLPDVPIAAAVGTRRTMDVLPVAAIYGANAAGKTNVLNALDYMQDAVIFSHSAWKPGGGTLLKQFRMPSSQLADMPQSIFEVDIVLDNNLYTYGFSGNAKFFNAEWLHTYPLGRERTLFRRKTNSNDGKFDTTLKFSPHLSGDDRDLNSMARRTRENSLFLAVAAQENQLEAKRVLEWFSNTLRIDPLAFDATRSSSMDTSSLIEGRSLLFQEVLGILKAADRSLVDVEVQAADKELPFDIQDPKLQELLIAQNRFDISFVHEYDGERLVVPFRDESSGIRKLYGLASGIVAALLLGDTLVVDELEKSIHPAMARYIIDLFQSKSTNLGNGQIIFSTHDTNLLDQSLIRRDQIWFVEKNACQSELYSLLEFSPRKDENLETGYLRGRYGALPALGIAGWGRPQSIQNEG
ncbi:ATP-binding protein [Alsobacter sp. KACC 23698]|uniref:ATP-binding protein n=1 Tax=Alsobacter sp. KACC 23698 TaxID=3149229 RepID=A0AAU7JFI7_9HYPH